jgi:hypothetical protein
VSTIRFVDDTDGIVPIVDRERLDRRVGEPGWSGLWGVEARVAARLLQGWRPSHLGLDRAEYRPSGTPIATGPDGWTAVPVDPITEVVAILPGGDHPEVDGSEIAHLASRDGVPVMGCSCGGGVGCAALEVELSFARDRVFWSVGQHRFDFGSGSYFAAVRNLLHLLGEAPVLITDEEWARPTPTVVLPVDEVWRRTGRWKD